MECVVLLVFFFQAEDGIRDDLVTGVQTCALPIYLRCRPSGGCRPVETRAFQPANAAWKSCERCGRLVQLSPEPSAKLSRPASRLLHPALRWLRRVCDT